MNVTLREVLEQLSDNVQDAPLAGVAIILSTHGKSYVIRTMEEDLFIDLCQRVTGGRAIEVGRIN